MGNDINLQWSKLIPLSLTDDSLKQLKLDGIGGVFRISKKEIDDKFYVIYVGSSSDMGKELLRLISIINKVGEYSLRYALLADENIRKGVEKQMYKYYAPIYNSKEPDSLLITNANLN